MKKYLSLLVATFAFTSSVHALQFEPREGFSYQAFLGMNVSAIQNTELGSKIGVNLGGRVQYFLPKAHGTYISLGFDWTQKGGTASNVYDFVNDDAPAGQEISGTESTYASQLHYFEIPVHLGFHYNLNEKIGFWGEVGPYFAMGFTGKSHYRYSQDGEPYRTIEKEWSWGSFSSSPSTIDPNNDKDVYHHSYQNWDAGVGFRIGAEYNKHYSLMLGWNWGLSDIYRNAYRDAWANAFPVGNAQGFNHELPKAKNFAFTVAFAYRF